MGITFPELISDTIQTMQRRTGSDKVPAVDIGDCSECGGCVEVAPFVFRFNRDTGLLEVCDLDYYDSESVNEAIKNCPEDCIYWEID